MDEVEEKTADGIDGFFDRLNEAADVVTAKLIEVSPEAADAILNLVQFKGVFEVVVGAMVLFLTGFTVVNYFKFLKNAPKDLCGSGEYDVAELDIFRVFAQGFIGFILIVSFLFEGLPRTFSFYNWLSAFYPEGAIALKALQAVGIDL